MKFVVGYKDNTPTVLWQDISGFKETVGENSTVIRFKENGVTYTYIGNLDIGFKEMNKKAPNISSYKVLDADEVMKSGILDHFLDILDNGEDEEPYYDDYIEPEYGHRHVGCGYHSGGGCGTGYTCGVSRHSCGGSYGSGC